MASSLRTKLRIAASVLFATGFFDAVTGRFLWQPRGDRTGLGAPDAAADDAWVDLTGAIHVHSTYSDGAGDIPTVMAGACAAGIIDFVLLTDHNSQQPLRDGWEVRYERDRPFLLIGAEVTVEHGAFLLALDMPAAWEPDKEKPSQVAIDAILADGGLALVSLPFDVKHPWRDWDARGYEGLEVLNLSTVARLHINFLSLLWLLPVYRLRGMPAVLRTLVTRPDQALARWDSLTAEGAVQMVGIGSLDAHALMKIGGKKYPIPSYADSFGVATTHVLVPANDAGSAASASGEDASAPDETFGFAERRKRAIYDALRRGRCYFAYDCLGDPQGFSFRGAVVDSTNAAAVAETIPMGGRGPLGAVLEARARGRRTLIRLYRDGRVVAASRTGFLRFAAATAGAYRVEVVRFSVCAGPLVIGARPWIFSNPIYIT